MAACVALAISFPYQGSGDLYLRAAAVPDSGGKDDITVEENTVMEDITLVVVGVGEKRSGVESSASEKSNVANRG